MQSVIAIGEIDAAVNSNRNQFTGAKNDDTSDEACDVGNFEFILNVSVRESDDSSSSNKNDDDKISLSIQKSSITPGSIPSAEAHAVGAGADCALLMELVEAGGDDSKCCDIPQAVHQPLSSSSITKSSVSTSLNKKSFHALGLKIDEEPDRGGANEDAASMDVSAITMPYTAPPSRKRRGMLNGNNNIDEQVIEGIECDTGQRQHSNGQNETTEFEVMDDETDQVSVHTYDRLNEGMPASEREHEIGYLLTTAMHNLDVKVLEGCLLDLRETSDISSSEMAKKNIRLGNLAVESAAFNAAVIYFKMGRGLLGPKAWEENPDVMLQLCSEEANACFATGDMEMTNALVDDVLKRDIPVRDKFRAYEVKILSLQASQRFDESITTALDVRRQLGLRSPSNKAASTLTTLKEYIKTRRVVKNRSSDELVALPDLKDERIIMGQRLLELLIPATYQAQPTLFPLVVFLLVRTSIKHGINASSCDAFACYGLLLSAAFGKFDEGKEMARTVERLVNKPGMQRIESRSTYILQGFICHWTSPVLTSRDLLLKGYQIGLETGDVESAAFNISFRVCHGWFAYLPLAELQKEFEASVKVLVQLNQRSHERNLQAYLLVVRRLRNLDSKAETEVGFEELLKADKEPNVNIFHTVKLMQLELCVLFREWECALLCLTEAPDIRTNLLGTYASVRVTFLEALVYLKASTSATSSWLEKQKWRRKATKSIKILDRWMEKGNPNVRHYIHILKAERALLDGNWKASEDHFSSAITFSEDCGFLHDEALSHELASACYGAQGKEFLANFHFQSSQRTYMEWGATAKLETQYIYYNSS